MCVCNHYKSHLLYEFIFSSVINRVIRWTNNWTNIPLLVRFSSLQQSICGYQFKGGKIHLAQSFRDFSPCWMLPFLQVCGKAVSHRKKQVWEQSSLPLDWQEMRGIKRSLGQTTVSQVHTPEELTPLTSVPSLKFLSHLMRLLKLSMC